MNHQRAQQCSHRIKAQGQKYGQPFQFYIFIVTSYLTRTSIAVILKHRLHASSASKAARLRAQTYRSHRLTNRTELPAPNSTTAKQVKALYLHRAHKTHSSLDVSCLTCLVMNATLVLALDFTQGKGSATTCCPGLFRFGCVQLALT